ncbi:MAG: hypothetical protein NC489_33285 [Ruminococcus flavefaciens]|nr:hypothetical protein [Ruminococcus flavefaciens]
MDNESSKKAEYNTTNTKWISKNKIFIILSVLLLLSALLIGPFDFFSHGYFYNEIDMSVASADLGEPVNLNQSKTYTKFTPIKKHMTGFEIYMTGHSTDDPGCITAQIEDSNGKFVDSIKIPISEIKDREWYKVYTNVELKIGETYILRLSAYDSTTNPSIYTIDGDYLGDEVIEGNTAIVFAYKKPTFPITTKFLIILFVISIWLYMTFKCGIVPEKKRRLVMGICGIVFMTAVLSWNFMYNSFDNQNSGFDGFQADSETLVTGTIKAEEIGTRFKESGETGYGLGRFQSTIGNFNRYGMAAVTNDIWNVGYSKTEPVILVSKNSYTFDSISKSSAIKFSNGDVYNISNYEDDGTYFHIYLTADRVLNPLKHGNIEDIKFVASDGWESDGGLIAAYGSQYGLQGKIYRSMARIFSEENEIAILNLVNAMATAFVLSLIVFLLGIKYNKVFAGTFYAVFLLSPWIVNFARNLYWVEFTWFIPMLAGLFCSIMIKDRKFRILSYVAAYIAIVVKCLCGYEYISSVMLGLISFLLVDFAVSVIEKDREKSKLLFGTIFIIGVIALAGFITAICIHAPIKGEGDISLGIKRIIENDVLRRTNGANLNDFDSAFWPSMNVSIWEVFCTYFKFSTEVITGIAGNLFPIICCVPLAIFVYDYRTNKLNKQLVAMYIVFFCVAVSWFSLAKSHSYIHTHMNYVLWYMGFIQVCLYTIVKKIVDIIQEVRGEN